MNRRTFLKVSAVTIASAAVVCGGGTLALQGPKIELPETSYGDETMSKKVLIAYASKCGSTADIAAKIGEIMSGSNLQVDVKPVRDITDISGYSAVVVGSAVRFGQWLPEGVSFLKSNRDALQSIPTALFTVHMQNTGDSAEARANRDLYVKAAKEQITPKVEKYFTGMIEMARLSFLERMVYKAVKAKDGDDRDWNDIQSWAAALPAGLNLAA
jgi:menaquinone-dependent protoporphyrinogen oxidase